MAFFFRKTFILFLILLSVNKSWQFYINFALRYFTLLTLILIVLISGVVIFFSMNLYFTFCRRVLLFPLPGGSCAVDVVRVAVQPLPGVLPPLWPHLLVPAGPDQQGDPWRGCEAPA